MRAASLALFVAWLAVCEGGLARDREAEAKKVGRHYRLAWDDLAPLVTGAGIALELPDGTRLRGRVMSVEAESLTLDVTKTSNRSVYGKGRVSLPRSAVREMKITKWRGATGRVIGTTIGVVLGSVPGLGVAFGAILEGAYWGPVIAGIIALPPSLGYLLGREADRRQMLITVEETASGDRGKTP